MEERLQKILSNAGIASRRRSEELIRAGHVTVDGARVAKLGCKYDPALHEIAVDGVPVRLPAEHIYILLNKPRGCISTAYDDRGRKTVLDLLPDTSARLYPVGRLDADTEGLLLITNDGAMTQGLLHPRFEIDKVYHAQVTGDVTEEKLRRLCGGVLLEDGKTAPARVRILRKDHGSTTVEVIIHEGRNRQVRRMFAAVGCRVCALRRVRFAMLTLKGLPCGAARYLTAEEIRELRVLSGVTCSEADCDRRRWPRRDDGGGGSRRMRRERSTARENAAYRPQDDDHGKRPLQRHDRR